MSDRNKIFPSLGTQQNLHEKDQNNQQMEQRDTYIEDQFSKNQHQNSLGGSSNSNNHFQNAFGFMDGNGLGFQGFLMGDQDKLENGKSGFKSQLEKYLYSTNTGKWFSTIRTKSNYLMGVISFFSSLAFVILTYWDLSQFDSCCQQTNNSHCHPRCNEFYNIRVPTAFQYTDVCICIIYLIEYLLKLFIAQNRLQYLTTFESISDLLVIFPPFIFQYETREFGLFFLSFSRLLRVTKGITILKNSIVLGETDVSRKIFSIMIMVLILIYISAGLYMVIENFDSEKNPEHIYFHQSFYFVVITVSTVGYGDYYPHTDYGKILTMSLIIFTIVIIIPQQTNELLRLMGLKSFYARKIYKSNPEIPHIVITGYVVVQAIRNFCEELFHQDHGSQDRHAVIIQQYDPAVDMEMFLHDPNFEKSIDYLNGNPIMSKDLKRADTEKAKTCILLTNKNTTDPQGIDHKNILIGLAMKKYVYATTGNPMMRLCMQLIKPESKQHYKSSLSMPSSMDQIIIVEEIKMNLMAKSCFAPGLISLISNLIASSSDQSKWDEDWLEEYTEGMGHEIYRISLSEKMEKKYFSDIARIVYKKTKAIVFAIEVTCNGKTIIRLNPSDFIIHNIKDNDIHVYMICPDKRTAESIETIAMNKDEKNRYFNMKVQKSKEHMYYKDELNQDYEGVNQTDISNTFIGEMENHEDPNYQSRVCGASLFQNMAASSGNFRHDESFEIQSDEQRKKDLFYLEDTKQDHDKLTKINLEDDPNIRNHIIVCGIHSSIEEFIMPLRSRYLKEYQLQKIVIITGEHNEQDQENGQQQLLNQICKYKDIYRVIGSPLKQETFIKANINYADKVVILGHDSTFKSDFNDEMLDAESIYIYKAIKKCNKDVQILTELVYNSNIEFLLSNTTQNPDYKLSTLYASGEVYISTIIDTLTCQAYFNPHIVTILQQILKGGNDDDDEDVNQVLKAHPDLTQSNLWQMPVPENCVGKTFEYLFLTLLDKKLITLGLYRLKGATDNSYPYVYTNPNFETIITHRDRAFVLGIDIPHDLQGDYYEMMEKETFINNSGQNMYGTANSGPAANLLPTSGRRMSDIGENRQINIIESIQNPRQNRKPSFLASDLNLNKRGVGGVTPTSLFSPQHRQQESGQFSGNFASAVQRQQQKQSDKDTRSNLNNLAANTQSQNTHHDQDEAIFGLKAYKNQPQSIQLITKKLEKSLKQIEKEVDKLTNQVSSQDETLRHTVKEVTREYLRNIKNENSSINMRQ